MIYFGLLSYSHEREYNQRTVKFFLIFLEWHVFDFCFFLSSLIFEHFAFLTNLKKVIFYDCVFYFGAPISTTIQKTFYRFVSRK